MYHNVKQFKGFRNKVLCIKCCVKMVARKYLYHAYNTYM